MKKGTYDELLKTYLLTNSVFISTVREGNNVDILLIRCKLNIDRLVV